MGHGGVVVGCAEGGAGFVWGRGVDWGWLDGGLRTHWGWKVGHFGCWCEGEENCSRWKTVDTKEEENTAE